MRTLSIVLLTFLTVLSHAQQVSRAFLPVNPKQEKVKVLANERSTFVIKTKADQSMEVIAFDAKLQEQWGIGITLQYPILHVAESYPDELVLLMSDTRRRKFVLLEIDAETGHYYFSEYAISTAFQGEQLARNQQNFWVKGWIDEEPVAFRLDNTTQTLKTLPIGHSSSVNRIAHFGYDLPNQELDILLETTENGYQAYLLRSINRKGEISRNLLLNHPNRNIADLGFYKPGPGKLEAIGTVVKSSQVKGLVWFKKNDAGLSMKEWELKDLSGLDRTWAVENKEMTSKSSKGLKSINAEIDEVFFSPDGELMVALETYEKDYEVRGLLQRESDEQSMVDQIDLNRYGRRDFDTNETTLNDRVDNFSNTEAATYRFRDVIIDRLQEQGNRHSQSVIFKINEEGASGTYLKVPAKVNSQFSIYDQNLVWQSYWWADDAGIKKMAATDVPELTSYDMSLGPYLKRIGPSEFLNFGFLLDDKVFYLMLQRIGLDDSNN